MAVSLFNTMMRLTANQFSFKESDRPCVKQVHTYLNESNIFDVNKFRYEAADWGNVEFDYLCNKLFLPFRSVFLHVFDAGLMLHDITPLQLGGMCDRHFSICFEAPSKDALPGDPATYVLATGTGHLSGTVSDLRTTVTINGMHACSGSRVLSFERGVKEAILLVDKDREFIVDQKGFAAAKESVIKIFQQGLASLTLLNTPENFIVRECPAVAAKLKAGEFLKQHQRPIYRFLEPREVRILAGFDETETCFPTGKKSPHERRAHVRTYRAERYTKFKGKTVVIPACWVGPSEATRGGKIYKVMLDM